VQHIYKETNNMAAAKSLTPAELERVLAHTQTQPFAQRNRCMLLLTVSAGLRVSEVAGLTVADVVNTDNTVKAEVYLCAARVKHGHSRTVFLNTRLQAELAQWVQHRLQYGRDAVLFNTLRGPRRSFTPNTLAQQFAHMYRGAGIAGASSHSGRKTFLTSLAAQGVSVFVLASLAGHKSIATTQRYVSVNDDVKRRAVELA
jgi:integrase/recombinase XerD